MTASHFTFSALRLVSLAGLAAGLAGCALSQVGNVGPDLGQGYIVDAFNAFEDTVYGTDPMNPTSGVPRLIVPDQTRALIKTPDRHDIEPSRTYEEFARPYGCAVLAATQVEEIEGAEWQDLGMPETLWINRVKEFGPLIISIDTKGNNLISQNKIGFNEKKVRSVQVDLPRSASTSAAIR